MSVVLDSIDAHTRYLVLGHRGTGAARRVLAGSMSIAIAGRCPVPGVVVPDGSEPGTCASGPVVVGVSRPEEDRGAVGESAVLWAAFERARELQAPLVVVHAWEIPALFSWSPRDIHQFHGRVRATLASLLLRWQARYPDVEVHTRVVAERPSDALTDAAGVAQLIMLPATSTIHRRLSTPRLL